MTIFASFLRALKCTHTTPNCDCAHTYKTNEYFTKILRPKLYKGDPFFRIWIIAALYFLKLTELL